MPTTNENDLPRRYHPPNLALSCPILIIDIYYAVNHSTPPNLSILRWSSKYTHSTTLPDSILPYPALIIEIHIPLLQPVLFLRKSRGQTDIPSQCYTLTIPLITHHALITHLSLTNASSPSFLFTKKPWLNQLTLPIPLITHHRSLITIISTQFSFYEKAVAKLVQVDIDPDVLKSADLLRKKIAWYCIDRDWITELRISELLSGHWVGFRVIERLIELLSCYHHHHHYIFSIYHSTFTITLPYTTLW